jgi:dTDP-4-dehydrorhamnose 3,5-epimerase
VRVRELSVRDSFVFAVQQFPDDRGTFMEWYRQEALAEAVGHPLGLAQANCSVSHRGVLRGVHFAQVPPSQAKLVTCVHGAVLDAVVDLRVGSPTFGRVELVRLDDVDRNVVYLAEGLGHAFLSLADGSVVTYLCSEVYRPGREHAVHPLDPALGIDWPADIVPRLSAKDAAAPTLAQAAAVGLLPSHEDCRAWYGTLRDRLSNSCPTG